MRFARRLLIFSYGLFTIAAQTLLFREFITTFQGNDISVGIFFGSWFLWIGLGAILVYRVRRLAEILLKNIEFLLLLFLPAFILQLILVIQARELAGIESYALLPIRDILLLSIVVNAPVSVITGMLFPVACRWVKQYQQLAISRVYIIEAAGSFCGGLGVTVLLALGVSSARIFLILAFIISLSTFAVQLAKLTQCSEPISRKYRKMSTRLVFLLPLCVLLCLAVGVDKALMRNIRVVKWTKLLPKDALIGSFQTAQAEYLYGIYQGQWIAIREGSVAETLLDESTAGRIAAIGLCQNPKASRVLVVGSGLGLCYQFLHLSQIEHVTWAHCDSEYVQKVDKFIPQKFKSSDKRFHRLVGDVRSLLVGKKRYYDIVILNLPDATSSVLNRYYTLEFYRQVKESLRPDGLLAVRISGGENIMGTELINLGASTKLTLEAVFSQLVLTPGEQTWFIASDSENLTGEPGILRDRFATIKGGTNVFPPEALLSVYLPDRAAAALENYSAADLPESLLINHDSRPLTNLYSLLLAAKQSEAPVTKFVKYLTLAGPLAFFIPVLVFVALRVVYVVNRGSAIVNRNTNHEPRMPSTSGFDSSFLVFSVGWIGIGVVIVLMYLYQTRFGSLYLHIGVISSLFMVGLTAGAALISYLVKRLWDPTRWEPLSYLASRFRLHASLLFALILVHTVVLATIAFWPAEQWTYLIFAIAFIICGLCAGGYFPLAARQLADAAFETGRAGSKLETADHIGASAGGLLTGLALVPVLGTKITLFVFILLILANIPTAAMRIYKPEKVYALTAPTFSLRRIGYILFGIGMSIVLCSNLLASAGARLRPLLPQYTAQALAGQSHIERASMVIGEGPRFAGTQNARKVNYFKVYETEEKLTGYVFSSQDLAPEVSGFGGKMNLAVYIDAAGRLIDFHIIRSNETPAYLQLLSQWRGLLNGYQLFLPQPFVDIHAVTGATISSKAILSALQISSHRFATQVLGHTLQPTAKEEVRRASYLPDTQGIYLISALILALIVIYRGGFWSRLAVLLFSLVVGGVVLNAQYSSEQIATILSLHAPAVALTGAFLLVVGIPLVVIFFGNIYCGYICPFGAAQELLGYVVPDRFKQPISAETMRKARFVKYIVLFVLIIVFFISRNRTTLAADPLIEVFSGSTQQLLLWVAGIALIGSVFYVRFWCRYLCPVGAFLSLLNGLAALKRFIPAKRFGRCEFGLNAKDRRDCLYCDRCRFVAPALAHVPRATTSKFGIRYSVFGRLLSRYFVVAVLVVATLVSTISISRFLQVSTSLSQPTISVSAGGQTRDVNLQRIRTMIRQKKLSDKEAEFYKKIE